MSATYLPSMRWAPTGEVAHPVPESHIWDNRRCRVGERSAERRISQKKNLEEFISKAVTWAGVPTLMLV